MRVFLRYFRALIVLNVSLVFAQENAADRVTVQPTPFGADLVTFFRGDLPELAILRDTLGDSRTGAHLFREVWSLTYVRPTLKQRVAAAVPFFYHRAGRNAGTFSVPQPILDVSSPSAGTWERIAETLIQNTVLDSHGMLLRAPTRSYHGNAIDYRNMFLARSLQVTENGATPDVLPADLSSEDWDAVRGRLLLGRRMLGGFVSTERAARSAVEEHTAAMEDRAANWDLLRQSAEKNGLYLSTVMGDGVIADGQGPREAMLWFAKPVLGENATGSFQSGFLRISDPWQDARLKKWAGYTQQWSPDESGAAGREMIPLALYALDYPRVPLLLIDFRSDRAKLAEITRRAADQVATGVFGLTPYGNLSWFAARTSYLWMRDRHGAALNRGNREAAYARLRQDLLDSSVAGKAAERAVIDRDLHEVIERRLDALALNPFEQDAEGERKAAVRQYAALLRWSADPKGLGLTLERARTREYYAATHTPMQRFWKGTFEVATFGVFPPSATTTPEQLAVLDSRRRLDAAMRVLRDAEALPDPTVMAEADILREQANEANILAGPVSNERLIASRILQKLPPAISVTAPVNAGSAGQ